MTREHWRVGFEKGLRTPLLSPEEAAAYPYTEAERAIIQRLRERAIVGTGEQVVAKLQALAADFALDEIVVNTWTHDPLARQRSYELIAAAGDAEVAVAR
jgi:alkanesulfonate monooxygenase SsuD/methylene tetrahydromethanopterin reductase-like flavin-dependent oxidoreductase (luciferase family)